MGEGSMPRWATQPFRNFIDHTTDIIQLTHASARGLSMLTAAPRLMEAVQKVEAYEIERSKAERNIGAEEAAKRLEQAREEATLARQEVDKGFPLLYSQALVSMWGSLEDLIHTFLAAWVMNEPNAKQADALQKLKVSLGEYEAYDDEEKGFYIVELLEKELRSPLKRGVSRFEQLLDSFGLSGAVEREVRENLFEVNHIRNVLVHRRGVADRRFVDACPHLGLSAGDKVTVDRQLFDQYSESIAAYVIHILERVTAYYEAEEAEAREVVGDTDEAPT